MATEEEKRAAAASLQPKQKSYTEQWGDMTTRRDAGDTPGVANVLGPSDMPGTAAYVRERAADEQAPPPAVSFPKSKGGSGGGVERPRANVKENKRKMTLDEMVADLMQQLSTQQTGMAAAPTAVNPAADPYQFQQPVQQQPTQQDPYAGLGDVGMPMGDPRLRRT